MHKHKRKWIKLVVKVWKWTQKRNFEVKWKRTREALFFCCLMEAGVGAEAEAVIFFSQATWRQSKTTGFSSLVDSWTSGQLFELQFWRYCRVPLKWRETWMWGGRQLRFRSNKVSLALLMWQWAMSGDFQRGREDRRGDEDNMRDMKCDFGSD